MTTETAKKVIEFQIISHGYMYPDYFQGCGVAFTEFQDVATGCGNDAKEAYEDAVESLAQCGWNVDKLPRRPRGIRASDRVPARCDEAYWYVSVRVR